MYTLCTARRALHDVAGRPRGRRGYWAEPGACTILLLQYYNYYNTTTLFFKYYNTRAEPGARILPHYCSTTILNYYNILQY